MLSKQHHDSTVITDKMSTVEQHYKDLTQLAASRRHRLNESKQLHEFNRSVCVDQGEVIGYVFGSNALLKLMHYMTLLYVPNREAFELEAWIREKETVASSEDTGKDLEHVEVRLCVK